MTKISIFNKLILEFGLTWICVFSLINSAHAQDLELSSKELRSIFYKTQTWYSIFKDSSYFTQDTIYLQTSMDFDQTTVSNEVLVWSFVNKKKIGFNKIDFNTAVSRPMHSYFKYEIEEKKEKLYLTIKHKKLKVSQYHVLIINHDLKNNNYKILLIRN